MAIKMLRAAAEEAKMLGWRASHSQSCVQRRVIGEHRSLCLLPTRRVHHSPFPVRARLALQLAIAQLTTRP